MCWSGSFAESSPFQKLTRNPIASVQRTVVHVGALLRVLCYFGEGSTVYYMVSSG